MKGKLTLLFILIIIFLLSFIKTDSETDYNKRHYNKMNGQHQSDSDIFSSKDHQKLFDLLSNLQKREDDHSKNYFNRLISFATSDYSFENFHGQLTETLKDIVEKLKPSQAKLAISSILRNIQTIDEPCSDHILAKSDVVDCTATKCTFRFYTALAIPKVSGTTICFRGVSKQGINTTDYQLTMKILKAQTILVPDYTFYDGIKINDNIGRCDCPLGNVGSCSGLNNMGLIDYPNSINVRTSIQGHARDCFASTTAMHCSRIAFTPTKDYLVSHINRVNEVIEISVVDSNGLSQIIDVQPYTQTIKNIGKFEISILSDDSRYKYLEDKTLIMKTDNPNVIKISAVQSNKAGEFDKNKLGFIRTVGSQVTYNNDKLVDVIRTIPGSKCYQSHEEGHATSSLLTIKNQEVYDASDDINTRTSLKFYTDVTEDLSQQDTEVYASTLYDSLTGTHLPKSIAAIFPVVYPGGINSQEWYYEKVYWYHNWLYYEDGTPVKYEYPLFFGIEQSGFPALTRIHLLNVTTLGFGIKVNNGVHLIVPQLHIAILNFYNHAGPTYVTLNRDTSELMLNYSTIVDNVKIFKADMTGQGNMLVTIKGTLDLATETSKACPEITNIEHSSTNDGSFIVHAKSTDPGQVQLSSSNSNIISPILKSVRRGKFEMTVVPKHVFERVTIKMTLCGTCVDRDPCSFAEVTLNPRTTKDPIIPNISIWQRIINWFRYIWDNIMYYLLPKAVHDYSDDWMNWAMATGIFGTYLIALIFSILTYLLARLVMIVLLLLEFNNFAMVLHYLVKLQLIIVGMPVILIYKFIYYIYCKILEYITSNKTNNTLNNNMFNSILSSINPKNQKYKFA